MLSNTRVIAICTATLFVPLLLPLLTGQVFAFTDLSRFHLPLRHLYRESLRAGDSFLWSPSLYSGFYVHGEGQAGMAHPLHLLLYKALSLGVAFNLEIVISYLAILSGMRVLLPRYGLSREAAWFGAMVFTFSGFNLLHLVHVNAIAVVSHLPWVLVAAHVLLTSSSPTAQSWAFGGVAILTASQVLLGYPQYVWFTAIALGCQAIALLLTRVPFSRVLMLGSAVGLGILMSAVQFMPTLDVLEGSLRSDASAQFRMSYSLELRHLLLLWSPNAFSLDDAHEFSLYNGAFSVLALAWLAVRWHRLANRRLVLMLLGLAAVALTLALGPSGGVYVWLSHLPGLQNFRAPARHIVLVHFALACLAAAAFDDVVRVSRSGEWIPHRRLWPLAVPVLFTLTTTIAAANWAGLPAGVSDTWLELASPSYIRGNLLHAWPWSCGLVGGAILLAMAARGKRLAVPAMIAAAAIDQGLWGYTYVYGLRGERVKTISRLATMSAPGEVMAGDVAFVAREGGAMGNLPILRGIRLTTGYVALVPSRVLDAADPTTLQLGGATWRSDGVAWSRARPAMPRARLVSKARWSANISADIKTTDVSRTALVDSAVAPLSGEPGTARVITDRPGFIAVETAAPGQQLLILTERFHKGWKATVDGEPRPLIRVFGDYLGCVVSAGTHRVDLRFSPDSLRTGLVTSAAGVILTLVGGWLLRRQRRPEQVAN